MVACLLLFAEPKKIDKIQMKSAIPAGLTVLEFTVLPEKINVAQNSNPKT